MGNRNEMLSRGVRSLQYCLPRVSVRLAHTDKHFPDLAYYRTKPVVADAADFIDKEIEAKELKKATFYTLNAALTSSIVWFAANVVTKCVNVLNPSQDILALATVEPHHRRHWIIKYRSIARTWFIIYCEQRSVKVTS